MSLNKNFIWLSAVAAVLTTGSSAFAQDPGACLVQSTSRLDALLSPAKGSDEKFFTSGGGPPNVMVMIDTSCSMADWPQDWPQTKGCNHPQITGLGFDATASYPGLVDNISGSTTNYNPDWFNSSKYYEAPSQGYGTNFGGTPSGNNYVSAVAACTAIGGINTSVGGDRDQCVACLNSQGYYVYNSNTRRVWGKFINFYAPRNSGAAIVLSQLAATLPNVRLGITSFGVQGDTNCWSGGKVCLMNEIGPSCANSFPMSAAAWEAHRNNLLTSISGSLKFGGSTPLASSLYASGHYFKNKSAYGTDPFNTWFGGGYPTASAFNEESITTGFKSVCASCGFNAIILITDGEPNNETIALPNAITSQSVTCVGGSCSDLNLAKVAKWFWEHDLRNDYTDVQKVATYAIGFSQDANSSGTLKTAAQYGGGKFFPATNTAALKSAIFTILDEVNSKNTSFSAAAIASVQSAGSTFAAILPRFSPQPNQPWIGTLQRFNLFNEFVEDYNLNLGEIDPGDGGADNDKSDIWLVDNTMPAGPYPPAVPTSSSRVVEDSNGKFVRWGTTTPATPYWEAGSKMVDAGYAARRIYTVRDSDLDGTFTSADSMITFTAGNAAVLADYLGVKGTSFCPSFAGALTCVGGSNNGLACTLAADGGAVGCPPSYKCNGGNNNGLSCVQLADGGTTDCPGGVLQCNGGNNDGNVCTVATAAVDCGYYRCNGGWSGNKCQGGPNNNQNCSTDSQCGVRSCQGICIGGRDDGDACTTNANCRDSAPCSSTTAPGTCVATVPTCIPQGAGASGDMLTKFGLTVAAAATELGVAVPVDQPTMDTLCVKALIEFVRGRDLADEDGDGDRAETRPSVLGDIFHSSPALVDPPVERFLCDIGISNQCVRTLYSQDLASTTATDNDSTTGTNCAATAVTRDAYDTYQYMNRRRDKLILVGANDGMLHAFHNGNATLGACTAGLQTVDYPATDTVPSDPGTEAWAFIPPDLLPRLQEHVFGHAYFVDGDIMVRDIWADGSGPVTGTGRDGKKQWDEFHTVAVIADGRGGTHYTALELRFTPTAGGAIGTVAASPAASTDTTYNIAAPGFLWMYPQPGSDEAAVFGKTLLSLSPKPPPIGPVLLQRSSIPGGSRPSAGKNRYACSDGTTPCDTVEQWVVMLGGGWTPSFEKGRGIYMVDAWNGKVNGRNDNLLWKAEYTVGATGENLQPTREMRYSITAPVAMIDYGSNSLAQLDGFFDTAAVGDVGGQLWLARFFKPGTINSSTGLVDNWAISRSFEMDERNDPNANGDNRTVRNVWPFYYLTSAGVQPDNDALRLFTGTGNRYALLEPNGGVCRFDNPIACAKYQCNDTQTEYKIQKNTINITSEKMQWAGENFRGVNANQTSSAVSVGVCGANNTTMVTASVHQQVNGCTPQTGSNIDFGDIRDTSVTCGKDGSGNFSCRRTDLNNANVGDLTFQPQAAVLAALGTNRFFGFWGYGGPDPTRKFEEDKTTTGAWKTAKDFDGTRISDRTTGNAAAGDLVDVTATTCTTASSCTGNQSTENGKGWFLQYSTLENRTASGPALLASCVLWNSIYPATAATTCGLAAVANGRFHQANYLTGAPNCAAGFKDSSGNFVRAMDRGVQAPPPEPATAIQISKTGKLRYSALLVEPGAKQATEANVTTGNDVLQTVYELPVSRALHNCRHNAGGSTNCVEAPP